MAKPLGKMETKRLLMAIESKAKKLWMHAAPSGSRDFNFSSQDMMAIEKICRKYLKKL